MTMRILKPVTAFHDPAFVVGCRIAANWGATTKPGKWMLATITAIDAQGRFDVAYDHSNKATYPESASKEQRVVLLKAGTKKNPHAFTWDQLRAFTDVLSLHVSHVIVAGRLQERAGFFTIQEVRQRAREEMVRTGKSADELLAEQKARQDRIPVKEHASAYAYDQSICWRLWNEINDTCFDGELRPPLRIVIESDLQHLLDRKHELDEGQGGGVAGYCDIDPDTEQEVILLVDDMDARELMEVMAHEMVHQHLAQTHGYLNMCRLGHAAVFESYAPRIARYYGIKLLGAGY